ncbi:hypothetical protein JL722_1505 [Aureococcus anophagefferens]|nr:hypothetical protein JL722_1505 [Aureococcus anophagefferens]
MPKHAKVRAGSGTHKLMHTVLTYEGMDGVELRDEAGDGALVGATSVMRYRGEVAELPGAARWALGVYDKSSGEVTFEACEAYAVAATPKCRVEGGDDVADRDKSWLERNIALADAFGTKKKQKQLRARVANMVDAGSVFAGDELSSTVAGLAEAAEAAAAAAPAPAAEAPREDYAALFGDEAVTAAIVKQRAFRLDVQAEQKLKSWVPADWSPYASENGASVKYVKTPALKAKLLSHILLAMLKAEGGTADMDAVSAELKTPTPHPRPRRALALRSVGGVVTPLPDGEVVLGREGSLGLGITSPLVSRQQALLVRDGAGGLRLVSRGRVNPTLLVRDGGAVLRLAQGESVEVSPGDAIVLRGDRVLREGAGSLVSDDEAFTLVDEEAPDMDLAAALSEIARLRAELDAARRAPATPAAAEPTDAEAAPAAAPSPMEEEVERPMEPTAAPSPTEEAERPLDSQGTVEPTAAPSPMEEEAERPMEQTAAPSPMEEEIERPMDSQGTVVATPAAAEAPLAVDAVDALRLTKGLEVASLTYTEDGKRLAARWRGGGATRRPRRAGVDAAVAAFLDAGAPRAAEAAEGDDDDDSVGDFDDDPCATSALVAAELDSETDDSPYEASDDEERGRAPRATNKAETRGSKFVERLLAGAAAEGVVSSMRWDGDSLRGAVSGGDRQVVVTVELLRFAAIKPGDVARVRDVAADAAKLAPRAVADVLLHAVATAEKPTSAYDGLKAVISDPGEAAAAASYVASCRAKLVSLYELYNPAKLNEVDDLLAKYAGREAHFLSAVERKYSGADAIPLLKDEAAVMQGDVDAFSKLALPAAIASVMRKYRVHAPARPGQQPTAMTWKYELCFKLVSPIFYDAEEGVVFGRVQRTNTADPNDHSYEGGADVAFKAVRVAEGLRLDLARSWSQADDNWSQPLLTPAAIAFAKLASTRHAVEVDALRSALLALPDVRAAAVDVAFSPATSGAGLDVALPRLLAEAASAGAASPGAAYVRDLDAVVLDAEAPKDDPAVASLEETTATAVMAYVEEAKDAFEEKEREVEETRENWVNGKDCDCSPEYYGRGGCPCGEWRCGGDCGEAEIHCDCATDLNPLPDPDEFAGKKLKKTVDAILGRADGVPENVREALLAGVVGGLIDARDNALEGRRVLRGPGGVKGFVAASEIDEALRAEIDTRLDDLTGAGRRSSRKQADPACSARACGDAGDKYYAVRDFAAARSNIRELLARGWLDKWETVADACALDGADKLSHCMDVVEFALEVARHEAAPDETLPAVRKAAVAAVEAWLATTPEKRGLGGQKVSAAWTRSLGRAAATLRAIAAEDAGAGAAAAAKRALGAIAEAKLWDRWLVVARVAVELDRGAETAFAGPAPRNQRVALYELALDEADAAPSLHDSVLDAIASRPNDGLLADAPDAFLDRVAALRPDLAVSLCLASLDGAGGRKRAARVLIAHGSDDALLAFVRAEVAEAAKKATKVSFVAQSADLGITFTHASRDPHTSGSYGQRGLKVITVTGAAEAAGVRVGMQLDTINGVSVGRDGPEALRLATDLGAVANAPIPQSPCTTGHPGAEHVWRCSRCSGTCNAGVRAMAQVRALIRAGVSGVGGGSRPDVGPRFEMTKRLPEWEGLKMAPYAHPPPPPAAPARAPCPDDAAAWIAAELEASPFEEVAAARAREEAIDGEALRSMGEDELCDVLFQGRESRPRLAARKLALRLRAPGPPRRWPSAAALDRGLAAWGAAAPLLPELDGEVLASLDDDELDALLGVDDDEVPGAAKDALRAARTSAAARAGLRRRAAPKPETLHEVVVVGSTGAGKSSLLNALVGEAEVLPTNCMRACTASVVALECLYAAPRGAPYEVEVAFLSRDEWAAALAPSRRTANNTAPRFRRRTRPRAPRAVAHGADAAWPAPLEHERLGTMICFGARDADELRDKLDPYVDSANDASALQLWPLVKRVTVRGPWACLGGLRLVDAPGVLDDNEARSRAVRGALATADTVLFASNVRRAVNDKSISDALPLSLRRDLAANGALGAVALVATQNDLVNRSEIVESLRLPEATSRLDAAKARAAFSRARAADTFWEGVPWRELPVNSGGAFDFAVFVASAVDCQKLENVKTGDGPPSTFESAADTDVPQLRAFLARVAAAGARGAKKPGALVLEALARTDARAPPDGEPDPKRARLTLAEGRGRPAALLVEDSNGAPAAAAAPPPARLPARVAAAVAAPPPADKPLKGFMLFSKEMRPKVKREFPGLSFGELGAKLGELWRGLESAAKASYTAGTVPAAAPAPPAPAPAPRPAARRPPPRPISEDDDIIDLT